MARDGAIALQARALARGEINFDAFVRRTRADWRRLGAWLYRHWPTPAAVTEEDVEQQLLLCAWRAWQRWLEKWKGREVDEEGVPIGAGDQCAKPGRYLTWTALAKATVWIHGQRGARMHGDPTHRPSHIATPASWFDRPGEDGGMRSFLDGVASPEAAIEGRLVAVQAVRFLAEACSDTTRRVLEHVVDADGDTALAASAVYEDTELVLRCWLKSEGQAARLVDKAVDEARTVLVGSAA